MDHDFFVGFGKTVLRPEEVVISVFIPFSRKVNIGFGSAADGDDGGPRFSEVDLSPPAGGGGPSFPTSPEEG